MTKVEWTSVWISPDMSDKARHAIRAAKNRYTWGRYAARQYCINNGVSMRLYRIACQLEAMA